MKTMIYHKFKAKPTNHNGVRYDSKKEAKYAQELDIRKKTGEIVFVLRQVPFHLPGGVVYRVDFVEFHNDGTVHFVDVKGHKTPMYITKKKQVEDLYPIKIEEI